MTAIEVQLVARVKKLPPNRVAEVVDFVDFLAAREERTAAARRLSESLAKLDALKLLLLSEDEIRHEIEHEIEAARHGRRSTQGA